MGNKSSVDVNIKSNTLEVNNSHRLFKPYYVEYYDERFKSIHYSPYGTYLSLQTNKFFI
jgi:hypothetical protein